MSKLVFDIDVALAAMCIMEEIAAPTLANSPWGDYREAVGTSQMRHDLLTHLAGPCNDKWDATYEAFEKGEGEDPGSFDWDFVPLWLRLYVDWSGDVPRVKGQEA